MRHIPLAILASAVLACSCRGTEEVIIPRPAAITHLGGSTPADATPAITIDEALGSECYRLTISKGEIGIVAGDDAGAFYAMQSLGQLKRHHGGRIPSQVIEDGPRFPYRGVHIDVSRNFRDKGFIIKQLHMFARLKVNRFHFHLTDGAGWRIAISKYPELTAKAAFRPQERYTDWRREGSLFTTEGAPDAHGGYYTREDIREIVAVADSLHITIIPEIEMFGHSREVMGVYPWLACCGDSDSDVYCIGREETFEFLEGVLDEVMEMFPSEYIHIGGDEADKAHWRECPDCRRRMRKEHLQSVDELQSYGIARIERFVNSRGRKIIGWDEILEGGLAPNAAVMSWRGEEGGRRAAEAGHCAIMTPGAYCYLDKCQDDPSTEPAAFGGNLSLAKVYSYDPAPEDMPGREFILGVQGNLWTEYVPTAEHAEHMLYPRVYALAETGWTPVERLDYAGFRQRALRFNEFAMADGYHPFDLAKEKGCREGYNEEIDHLAKGCGITYLTPYYEGYKADGEQSMCDGRIGGWDFHDRWMGWLNRDASFVIDLGEEKEISHVEVTFGQWRSAQIMLPAAVSFAVSADGESFREVYRESNEIDFERLTPQYKTFSWVGDKVPCRYLRVTGHINEDRWGWLFTDEAVVR